MLIGSLIFVFIFLTIEVFFDGKLKEMESTVFGMKFAPASKKKLLKQIDWLEHRGFLIIRGFVIVLASWLEGLYLEGVQYDFLVWILNITTQVFGYWLVFDLLYNVQVMHRSPLYIGSSAGTDKFMRRFGKVGSLIIKLILLSSSVIGYIYFINL